MAEPVKKGSGKSTAKKAEAAPDKPDSAAKKRATTSKSAKPPADPGKVKTEPQKAHVEAAPKAAEPAAAAPPRARPKSVTARATKAKEETSPLIPKSDPPATPADGPHPAAPHPVHNQPKITAQERYDLVAMTAYYLYTQRGGQHGKDIDDWVAAEALVAARLG